MTGSRTLLSVQYLRAIAAVIVVAAHAFAHPLAAPPLWTWIAGRIGVTLFFVISGFIMTLITPAGRFDPKDFLLRRLLRICPLYWSITLLTALIAATSLPVFRHTQLDFAHLFGSILFIPMYRPGNPGAIEPFVKLGWTLNYEIFFYLIFSSLFFLQSRRRTFMICITIIILSTVGRLHDFDNPILRFITGYDIIGFGAGAAAGQWFSSRLGSRSEIRFLSTAFALTALALAAAATQLVDRYPDMRLQILIVAFSTTTVLWLARREQTRGLPQLPSLETLGSASYSTYLVHMFPIGFMGAASAQLLGAEPSGHLYLIVAAAGLILGVFGGLLTYRLVERPLLRAAHAAILTPRPASPIARQNG